MHEKSSSLLLVYFVAEVQRHLQARHMYYSVSSGSSCLVWSDTFLVPIACGRKTFLITISVRFRYRPCVAAALMIHLLQQCLPEGGDLSDSLKIENRGQLQGTSSEQPFYDPIWVSGLASFLPHELMVHVHFCNRDRV